MIKLFNQYIKESKNSNPIINIAKQQGIPLNQITTLNCSYKYLTSLEGIEKLTNLEKLYCYWNRLTSLKGIEKLTNLTHLYCSGNHLTSLEGIENLTNLEILECSNNNFPDEYKEYFLFEIKLDRAIKDNDFLEFSKIYNSGEIEWRKTYKNKRPELEDIINGINIGMF